MHNNYLGPSYTNREVKKTLNKYKLKYKYTNNPCLVAAKLIFNNKIIGWFQGSLELVIERLVTVQYWQILEKRH